MHLDINTVSAPIHNQTKYRQKQMSQGITYVPFREQRRPLDRLRLRACLLDWTVSNKNSVGG